MLERNNPIEYLAPKSIKATQKKKALKRVFCNEKWTAYRKLYKEITENGMR